MLTGSSRWVPEDLGRDAGQQPPPSSPGSTEEAESGKVPAAETAAGESRPVASGTKALDQYTINLTDRARKGEIDPVLGRDFEIRQMVDILIRRRQNNPILTGEAGVGKTAVVEGFALKIAEGDVPPPLRNVAIHVLDLGLLQAGAGIKGEFENRLKSVINEVKASPVPIILFIDEAHTMIGAGGSAGQGMPLICSSRPWPGESCEPSPPRPGPSTRSILRRMRPWRGASRWSRWRNPTSPRPSA